MGSKKKKNKQTGGAEKRLKEKPAAQDLPGGKFPAWAVLLLIIFAATIPFLNTFGNEFTNYDETAHILENEYIRDLSWENVKLLMSSYTPGVKPVVDYPLYHLSFAINYKLHGYAPWGYHFGNLLLHVISCLLLFALLRLGPWRRGVALWATLIFAVHPVHVESVTWIISRKDVLSTAFTFGAMVMYLRVMREKRFPMAAAGYVVSIFLWVAAVYSKPIAAVVPALLAVWIIFLESKEKRARALLWLGPWFASTAFFSWALMLESAHRNFVKDYLGGSMIIELYSKVYVLLHYVETLLIPVRLSAYYEIKPPHGWSDPLYLCSAVAVVIIAVVFAALARKRTRLWFYPAWFIVALLPTLSLVPIDIRMADRYLYVPSVAYCLALAACAHWLMVRAEHRKKSSGKIIVFCFALIITAYAVITVGRNTVWKNSFTLWADTVKKCDDCSFVLNNLGTVTENNEEAEALFIRAGNADPTNFAPFANLGSMEVKRGDFASAINNFETAMKLKPESASIRLNLANAYVAAGKPEQAMPHLNLVYNNQPENQVVVRLMCIALAGVKDYAQAIPFCENFLGGNPSDRDGLWSYASALFATGKIDAAEKIYESFTNNFPKYAPAWTNLGLCKYGSGDLSGAKNAWQRALEIDPANQKAKEYLVRFVPPGK